MWIIGDGSTERGSFTGRGAGEWSGREVSGRSWRRRERSGRPISVRGWSQRERSGREISGLSGARGKVRAAPGAEVTGSRVTETRLTGRAEGGGRRCAAVL